MGERGRRALLAAFAVAVLLLFAGRWGAGFAAERWWAEAVAPGAVAGLTRWHLLRLALEIGGILVAGVWCVGHLLIVVRSIGTVQIPRRIGDLEIREVLTPSTLVTAAVVAGGLLGILVGSGGGALLGQLLLAWHGVRFGIADPVLGLDAGVYIAQLPLWALVLDRVTLLLWLAIALAVVLHPVVGSLRVSRRGIALTDTARLHIGGLLAAALALAAVQEALAPLTAIGAATGTATLPMVPVVYWVVAGCWGIGALLLARWTVRPRAGTVLLAVTLWAATGIASRLVLPMFGDAVIQDQDGVTRIAALGTGIDRLVETTAAPEREPPAPTLAAYWAPEWLVPTLEVEGGRVLALGADRARPQGSLRPTWVAVRTGNGGAEVVQVADDRLAPGGGTVSYRRGDPREYHGVVSWAKLGAGALYPGAPDTALRGRGGTIPLGGPLRRLILAWGTQTLPATGTDAGLAWRLGPSERVAHLIPGLEWGPPRPALDSAGALIWLVDGWVTSPYAPFAPAVVWIYPEFRRYLRPVMLAMVAAESGEARIFLRPDVDPVGAAWGEITGPLVERWERAPTVVRESDLPLRWLAKQGMALMWPPFAEAAPAEPLPGVPMPAATRGGGVLEGQLIVAAREGRVEALLRGVQEGGVLRATLVRWDSAAGPEMPERYSSRWLRFASFERLRDSTVAAGGRVVFGPVRLLPGAEGTVVIQFVYLIGPRGAATVGWVNVGAGDRIGAARTPAAAWANLRGESAPVVPGPEMPDRLQEARRWATLADSALRAGDLEGFGRAFEALKRVLATP